MIIDCQVCAGTGGVGDMECPRCLGVRQLSDDCSNGHEHCVDVIPDGQAEQVLCIDCQTNLGRKTEVYSRVVGYLRPVSAWNKGKCAEFAVRTTYNLAKGIEDANKTGAGEEV